MSKATRTAVAMAVVVIAVVVFIIVKPSSKNSSSSTSSNSSATTSGSSTTASGKPAKPAVPTVQVKNAKPVGGIQDLTFNKGGTVQFKVVSDTADEVHVHGYDFHKNVAPGHPITFKFPAKIDGEFVVELESRGEQIASLRVNP
jgi:hypothetical protein